jgi:hypothetical protein
MVSGGSGNVVETSKRDIRLAIRGENPQIGVTIAEEDLGHGEFEGITSVGVELSEDLSFTVSSKGLAVVFDGADGGDVEERVGSKENFGALRVGLSG